MALATILVISGCVQPDIALNDDRNTQKFWGETSGLEDVNISDMNMTESETMIMEDDENRMDRVPFPDDEYNVLLKQGKGTVKGTIFIEDYYGKKVLGKNTRLYLNPLTSYSQQWYNESYLGGMKMQKADPKLFNYLRFTASDTKGRFSFYGVPSGEYYLIGTVECGDECGYGSLKKIRIAVLVEVRGSNIVQQDLNRRID